MTLEDARVILTNFKGHEAYPKMERDAYSAEFLASLDKWVRDIHNFEWPKARVVRHRQIQTNTLFADACRTVQRHLPVPYRTKYKPYRFAMLVARGMLAAGVKDHNA